MYNFAYELTDDEFCGYLDLDRGNYTSKMTTDILAAHIPLLRRASSNSRSKRDMKSCAKMKSKGFLKISSSFADDRIILRESNNEIQINYSMLERIALTDECICIYPTLSTAFIIPFRVFAGQEECEYFIKFVNARISSESQK